MSGFFNPTIALAGKTLKTAPVSASSSGDNTIVAAVTSRRIKVIAFLMQAVGTTVTAKWKDGASVDLTGGLLFNAREGVTASVDAPSWLFATTAGNALVLNLDAAQAVTGFVTYFEDDT